VPSEGGWRSWIQTPLFPLWAFHSAIILCSLSFFN
jgi:hypothetical protein